MGAFNKIGGNLVMDQGLISISVLSAGVSFVRNVKVPSSAVAGVNASTKLTSTLKAEIQSLAGTNPVLSVSVKNLTQATGEVIEQEYTTVGFVENLQIPCLAGDVLEYTFLFTNDGVSGNGEIESSVLVNVTAK